jgi:lathosterol oxidase
MLCEISPNPILTWMVLNLLGLAMIGVMSGGLFLLYYVRPTYDKWLRKSNPEFPAPASVKQEILQMTKGMMVATLCPAIAMWMGQHGYSKAYCGVGDMGVPYLVASFFGIWIASDLFEFAYHQLGHLHNYFWNHHRVHHQFYNPSPFAVM